MCAGHRRGLRGGYARAVGWGFEQRLQGTNRGSWGRGQGSVLRRFLSDGIRRCCGAWRSRSTIDRDSFSCGGRRGGFWGGVHGSGEPFCVVTARLAPQQRTISFEQAHCAQGLFISSRLRLSWSAVCEFHHVIFLYISSPGCLNAFVSCSFHLPASSRLHQFDYSNGLGGEIGRFKIDLYLQASGESSSQGDCGQWVGSICDRPDIGCRDTREYLQVVPHLIARKQRQKLAVPSCFRPQLLEVSGTSIAV